MPAEVNPLISSLHSDTVKYNCDLSVLSQLNEILNWKTRIIYFTGKYVSFGILSQVNPDVAFSEKSGHLPRPGLGDHRLLDIFGV